MAIYYSPYDTTIGKMFNTKDSVDEIKKAITFNYPWMKVNEQNKVIFVYPNGVVPRFEHPLTVETVKGLKYTVCDLSAFVREKSENEYTVANKPLYSLQTIRTYLTADLLENGTRFIKTLSNNVMRTYCDLITSSLSMAFSLNAEEIMALRALSAFMYVSMLTNEEFAGDMDYDMVIAKITRDTGIPSSFLYNYLDTDYIKDVAGFIEVIKSKLSNPAIQKLNEGLFYTIIAKNMNANVWIGLEKQQILSMSIEHIPTFISVLVICLSEQVFKNAGLTKMALKNFTRDKAQFILAVNSIINNSY